MTKALSVFPGADLNFSQPIMDNVEEAVSGVKGSICVKIFGDSLDYMEGKADSAVAPSRSFIRIVYKPGGVVVTRSS